jgi:[ribosomal protein S5]-alanine N-acetyltransferase
VQILETKRLRLRLFTPDDAAFIMELLNEPGWKRFIGDRGINSLEDAEAYINKLAVAYEANGFGLLAAERLEDGDLVGMCGLIKRETLEHVDVGFALLSRFEGNGYAQEALKATLEYGRDQFGLERIVAITTDDNMRSGRVLERAGMKFEGMTDQGGEMLRLYSINY